MKNVSVHLVGGELDGQTYTAREDEKILRIHSAEKKDIVTDIRVNLQRESLPQGHFYIYQQESEGSDRFVYVKSEG